MTAAAAPDPARSDPPPPPAPSALAFSSVTVLEWDRRSADPGALFPILDAVDWTVRAGEHWAVLGPNGAGKTTLLDLAAARSVLDVTLTGTTGSIAMLMDRVEETDRDRALRLLELFGCGRLAARQFGRCSQGERRRVLLARALMHRPPLLLLDEPADGLDLPGREALLAALEAIAREEPATALVLVTHHLEELPASITHALLLRRGRTTAQGPVAEVLTDAPLSECFGVAVEARRHDGRWSGRARPSW